MNPEEVIRNKIQFLYRKHPHIHVNILVKRPRRVILTDLPVIITGVYPHMFKVEYTNNSVIRSYMHQYTDLITKDVEILELPDLSSRMASKGS